MPRPELSASVEAMAATLNRRNQLMQELLTQIKDFDGTPRNIEIPASYSVTDAQSTIPLFAKLGLLVELRFVNNARPYFRFMEAG